MKFKLTENDMLVIEPSRHHRGDEELGPVGVGSSISHGQKASLGVQPFEILIWKGGMFIAKQSGRSRIPTCKFVAIDRFAASTVVAGKITALKHKLRDHTVKCGSFVAIAIFTSCQCPEVCRGPGDDVVV